MKSEYLEINKRIVIVCIIILLVIFVPSIIGDYAERNTNLFEKACPCDESLPQGFIGMWIMGIVIIIFSIIILFFLWIAVYLAYIYIIEGYEELMWVLEK